MSWRRPVGLVAQAASNAETSRTAVTRWSEQDIYWFTKDKDRGGTLSHRREMNAIGRVSRRTEFIREMQDRIYLAIIRASKIHPE
jgi:hypothetical protein